MYIIHMPTQVVVTNIGSILILQWDQMLQGGKLPAEVMAFTWFEVYQIDEQ